MLRYHIPCHLHPVPLHIQPRLSTSRLLPPWDRLPLSLLQGSDDIVPISHLRQHHQYHRLMALRRLPNLPTGTGGDIHQGSYNIHGKNFIVSSSICLTSLSQRPLPLISLIFSFFLYDLSTWSLLAWAHYLRVTGSKAPCCPPSRLKEYSCISRTHSWTYCSCKCIGRRTRCPHPLQHLKRTGIEK